MAVFSQQELTEALDTAISAQMKDGKTTFIEVMLNQELGEPFRRDAMKTPVAVAGIDPADMRSQPLAGFDRPPDPPRRVAHKRTQRLHPSGWGRFYGARLTLP